MSSILTVGQPPTPPLFPYTTLFRSEPEQLAPGGARRQAPARRAQPEEQRREADARAAETHQRSEEHTSELQSLRHLVCRLLLEKKNTVLDDEAYAKSLRLDAYSASA